MNCENCKTDIFIIHDTVNGTYVCRECGLVVSEFSIVDEATFDKATNNWTHELPEFILSGCYGIGEYFHKKLQELLPPLQLPDCIEHDVMLFHDEFLKKYSMQGRSTENMIYAYIVIASKNRKSIINFVVNADIMECIKFLNSTGILPQSPEENPMIDENTDPQMEGHIKRFTYALNMKKEDISAIIKMIPMTKLVMRKKEIIAIGLIVIYTKKNKLVKELSKKYGLTESSIKAAMKDILSFN